MEIVLNSLDLQNRETNFGQMRWLTNFLSSSIGQKVIMSLTGLFLITFLIIHLSGNLQLLVNDNGQQFNIYAKFMTSNPLIKFVSIGLYAFILLHAIQGIYLWRSNSAARKSRYAKQVVRTMNTPSAAAKNMGYLGLLILVFLIMHMGDFWYKMKFGGNLDMITYAGYAEPVKDLFSKVELTFSNPLFVGFYLVSMAGLAAHLKHGFQSAFQTLGLNHKKYTPIVQGVGTFIAFVIPLLFAIIPVLMYLGIYPLNSFLH